MHRTGVSCQIRVRYNTASSKEDKRRSTRDLRNNEKVSDNKASTGRYLCLQTNIVTESVSKQLLVPATSMSFHQLEVESQQPLLQHILHGCFHPTA